MRKAWRTDPIGPDGPGGAWAFPAEVWCPLGRVWSESCVPLSPPASLSPGSASPQARLQAWGFVWQVPHAGGGAVTEVCQGDRGGGPQWLTLEEEVFFWQRMGGSSLGRSTL